MPLRKSMAALVILTVAVVGVVLVSMWSRQGQQESNQGHKTHSNYTLPISERNFYIGMVPTPKSVPETSFDDLVNAYKEAGELGEVAMVWVSRGGIGEYEELKQNRVVTAMRTYGLEPILTLGFATIKEVPGEGLRYLIDAPEGVNGSMYDPEFRRLWVNEAKSIAEEFRPRYFSLGNEINDYFYLNPDDLQGYLTLFDEAYRAIKEVSPDTMVFVVFSYTHLIDNNQWDLFGRFNDRVDMFGLTTYPRKHFDTPAEIDQDYYSRLNRYTQKPIAFTEIGWPSTNGEAEQAEFLVRFLELTKGVNVEMVNWLFLHEVQFTGRSAGIFETGSSTIALKRSDGTRKEVYYLWLDLKELTLRRNMSGSCIGWRPVSDLTCMVWSAPLNRLSYWPRGPSGLAAFEGNGVGSAQSGVDVVFSGRPFVNTPAILRSAIQSTSRAELRGALDGG